MLSRACFIPETHTLPSKLPSNATESNPPEATEIGAAQADSTVTVTTSIALNSQGPAVGRRLSSALARAGDAACLSGKRDFAPGDEAPSQIRLPLCRDSASPRDFHLQAVDHARHTRKRPRGGGLSLAGWSSRGPRPRGGGVGGQTPKGTFRKHHLRVRPVLCFNRVSSSSGNGFVGSETLDCGEGATLLVPQPQPQAVAFAALTVPASSVGQSAPRRLSRPG